RLIHYRDVSGGAGADAFLCALQVNRQYRNAVQPTAHRCKKKVSVSAGHDGTDCDSLHPGQALPPTGALPIALVRRAEWLWRERGLQSRLVDVGSSGAAIAAMRIINGPA